jgi:hypothetical protein
VKLRTASASSSKIPFLPLEAAAYPQERDVTDLPFCDRQTRAHKYSGYSRYLTKITSFRASL